MASRLEKIPISEESFFNFQGFFDTKEIFNTMKSFLEKERHYDLTERDFQEKDLDGERELYYKFDAEQHFNDYYSVFLSVEITLSGHDTEVKMNDRTRIFTEGKVRVKVNPYIKPDYLGKREKGPLGEFVGKVYDKFLGKEDLDEAKENGKRDMVDLGKEFRRLVNSISSK